MAGMPSPASFTAVSKKPTYRDLVYGNCGHFGLRIEIVLSFQASQYSQYIVLPRLRSYLRTYRSARAGE